MKTKEDILIDSVLKSFTSGNFLQVNKQILKDLKSGNLAVTLCSLLSKFRFLRGTGRLESNTFYCTYEHLHEDTGLSRLTLSSCVKKLKELNYLDFHVKYRGCPVHYTLNFRKIHEVMNLKKMNDGN